MATKQELEQAVVDARAKLEEAVKGFEAMRAKGTAADLVKTAGLVTSLTKAFEKAQREDETFALVGIYEGIKAQVLDVAKRWDVKTLAAHKVDTVAIVIPFDVDTGALNAEHVVVNTLGKRTRVASTGGGSGRGKNIYTGPDGVELTSRELVELHGAEVAGDQAQRVLDSPALGLTYMADRVAKAKGFEKGVKAEA